MDMDDVVERERDAHGRYVPVEDPQQTLSFKVRSSVARRIDAAAVEEGMTRQGWILKAVEQQLEP